MVVEVFIAPRMHAARTRLITIINKVPRKPCTPYLFGEQVIVVLKVHTIARSVGLFDKVALSIVLINSDCQCIIFWFALVLRVRGDNFGDMPFAIVFNPQGTLAAIDDLFKMPTAVVEEVNAKIVVVYNTA